MSNREFRGSTIRFLKAFSLNSPSKPTKPWLDTLVYSWAVLLLLLGWLAISMDGKGILANIIAGIIGISVTFMGLLAIGALLKSLFGRVFKRNQNRILSMATLASKSLCLLMPGWFLETFNESLIDDLFNFAKEEGGRIWWLRLVIAASGFVFKFAWRRFERRRSVETSGRLPAERDDEP